MAIRRLAPAVAARIAAGEVIERPASVVKELVENALDAGARRISVELVNGGLDEIVVADDGHGVAPDDLPLTFVRHATSKLETDADLDRVGTLGFRGEALASIAAVADVDLLTRTPDAPHGWRISVRAGEQGEAEPATRAPGTTVTVRSLFAELPARRKYVKGRSSEGGQVVQLVSALALAYPDVAFTLRSDSRRTLETPGDGDLRAAVEAVHGHGIGEYLVAVVADDDDGPTGATSDQQSRRTRVVVTGCLGWGEATLSTRAGVTLLVNRRWVQSRTLSYAIDEAYRSLVQVGRHPIAVVDVRVPPSEIDVNVHPRKAEVRLLHERAVFAAVQRAIRRTLAGVGGPRPTSLLAPDPLPPDPLAPDGSAGAPDGADWASGLRVLGQAGGAYIIAEGRAGIYLVDQHAAHERILVEALHAAWGERAERQIFLEPAVVEVAPRVAARLRDHLADLTATGFDVEPFGDGALLVRAVPAALATRDPLGALRATVETLVDEAPATDWRARLADLFACHTAIRAGDRLAHEEMSALVQRLGEADLCQACAHGRPTAILLSHGQLAREFGRLY